MLSIASFARLITLSRAATYRRSDFEPRHDLEDSLVEFAVQELVLINVAGAGRGLDFVGNMYGVRFGRPLGFPL
jgi:hypothetical protein